MNPDLHSVIVPFTHFRVETFAALYGNFAVFAGALLFGEFAVLMAFILAAGGVLSFFPVFILSVVGITCADLFWYGVGYYVSGGKPGWHLHDRSIIAQTAQFWERTIGKNIFISLLVVKFLYGVRWATIIFLGIKRLSPPFFLAFDILGILVFVGVLFVVGWVTGKGVYNLMPFYHGMVGVIAAIIVAGILVHLLHMVLQKNIKQKGISDPRHP